MAQLLDGGNQHFSIPVLRELCVQEPLLPPQVCSAESPSSASPALASSPSSLMPPDIYHIGHVYVQKSLEKVRDAELKVK